MVAQMSMLQHTPPGLRVDDLPESEKPVNRVREVGVRYVNLVELLAAIVQGGEALSIANQLVAKFGSLHGLRRAEESQLTAIDGIGPSQAARLMAALELGVRMTLESGPDREQIRSPSDASHILTPYIGDAEQENFAVLYLDTRNRVIDKEILYKGSLNTSLVRTAEVFRGAIRRNCASIIVAHNHPSGDPNPSPEDIMLTRRLVEVGKLMELDVLDHMVIGHNRYISLREQGKGFET